MVCAGRLVEDEMLKWLRSIQKADPERGGIPPPAPTAVQRAAQGVSLTRDRVQVGGVHTLQGNVYLPLGGFSPARNGMRAAGAVVGKKKLLDQDLSDPLSNTCWRSSCIGHVWAVPRPHQGGQMCLVTLGANVKRFFQQGIQQAHRCWSFHL
ncbi:hypothetical protein GN956_G17432 [Arapaima gigas]